MGKSQPEEILLKREGAVKLARWLRVFVPLIIATSTYMSITSSPLRPGFCEPTLPQESVLYGGPVSAIHEFLHKSTVMQTLFKIDIFRGFVPNCFPLMAISLSLGLTLISIFEAGFWLKHERPCFSIFWIMFASAMSVPLCL